MEKLRMTTADGVQDNVALIASLFPDCVTEIKDSNGNVRHAVDFDKLRQNLSEDVVEGSKERYQFTWPGKREAMHLANTPIRKTLRPYREESVGRDGTPGGFDSENLYIEGDNLDVLKCLREDYLGAVKMIYIDPPYNTGKDFVYNDKYAMKKEEFEKRSGYTDEEGNKVVDPLVRNTEANGSFHTDWLNMMYPRLKVARDLLSDDGVIFISIDDNEVENLRKICDEIFGEKNFVAQIIVEGTPKNDPYVFSTAHEYCLVYVRDIEAAKTAEYGISNPLYAKIEQIFNSGNGQYDNIEKELRAFYEKHDLLSENISNYKYADKDGVYRIGPIDDPQNSGPKDERMNPRTGRKCATPARGWSCTLSTWNEWVKDNLISFPESDDCLPSKKTYITSNRLDVMKAYFKMQTRKDTTFLKNIFKTSITPFSNPKPVQLLKAFVQNCNDKNMTVMDFFSGSGTMAHALYLANSEDFGNRKFILVQIPEVIEITSGQSNKEKKISRAAIDLLSSINKPANIAELAKERLRRVGKMIKKDLLVQSIAKGAKSTTKYAIGGDCDTDPSLWNNLYSDDQNRNLKSESQTLNQHYRGLDIGFRVLKLDSSNMQDVYYTPAETTSDNLLASVDNIKADRTGEDLLFQAMLELNIELSAPIRSERIGGKNVFVVDEGYLVACFDDKVDNAAITEIAKMQPQYFVMRDASAASDNVLDNFEQIFRHYSRETVCRVL